MSHLTQLERVKLGVTVHQILMPYQDVALQKRSTVAGPPSCASVALRRRLLFELMGESFSLCFQKLTARLPGGFYMCSSTLKV